MRARTFALAGAAGAAAAVAFALARLKRPRSAGGRPDAADPETYTCACGQAFRVAGSGRHRVYWPAGAPDDDPVLGPQCPACDRPLPRDGALNRAPAAV